MPETLLGWVIESAISIVITVWVVKWVISEIKGDND